MANYLPKDTIYLETSGGGLAVSPSHAVYCAIFNHEKNLFIQFLHDKTEEMTHALSNELINRLDQHGFFNSPRPLRPSQHLLQFQLTNACNLRCVYCSAESGCARKNEISFHDVKRVSREVFSLDPKTSISFTGGEPLLVPWLFDAIDFAEKLTNSKAGLLSNLLLLKNDDELCDRIAEHIKHGTEVFMSISGCDRKTCDKLSGKPAFDDALIVIHKLANRGALPQLDVMLSAPDSAATIHAFADFRRALPDDIKLTIGTIYPCGRETGEHTFNSEDELQSVLDALAFEGGVSIPAPRQSPLTHRRKACTCIENQNLFIRSDGTIFSCFKMIEPLGHISENIAALLKRQRQTHPLAAELAMCKNCPFLNMCAGGCRADNLILQRSSNAPICGQWKKKLIADMLFEDRPYVFDWPVQRLLSEAKKRGIDTPPFIITSFNTNGMFLINS